MAITFTDPYYLLLLAIIPLFVFIHFYSFRFVRRRALRFANFEAIKRIGGGQKVGVNWLIVMVRSLIILVFSFAAAGMIFWFNGTASNNNYVLAVDASGSMLADDFTPNRLEAAKKTARVFVDNLQGKSKIGVLSFAGVTEVDQAITTNKLNVQNALLDIRFKSIHGTAIGDAIKTSMAMFAATEGPQTIILLTDGQENIVSNDELFKIIEVAKQNQIKIHTIGIGTEEGGSLPDIDIISTLDDETLKQISEITQGKNFRVQSETQLIEAFNEISTSTKTRIPINLRLPFIIVGIILLFLEWGLINTKFKMIP